ncbi:nuclear transport factor 2 family protein [Ferrimonas pelagia]|uniref:Nuclear transport factor 2 family protein n=1 Tax=Ferrimonas pelagia TaxID=1177826 RepID=A0ABP9ESJ7_9GAMM
MRRFLGTILALVLSVTLPLWAADGPQGPQLPAQLMLAERYMQALTQRNYNQLARFYDRDTVWHDQTANKKITGRRDIIAFQRRVHTYTQEYEFVSDHAFYNGNLVVMIGSYYYKARGDLFGHPGESILFSLPGVTTLKLDMDKQRIKQHTDLLDYRSMKDQLKLY